MQKERWRESFLLKNDICFIGHSKLNQILGNVDEIKVP